MAADVRAEAGKDNTVFYTLIWWISFWLKRSADILYQSGFFLSLFLCGAGFLFRWIRAVISLPVCDLRAAVLAQWLRWLDTGDVEQCLGEGSAFA